VTKNTNIRLTHHYYAGSKNPACTVVVDRLTGLVLARFYGEYRLTLETVMVWVNTGATPRGYSIHKIQ
jgi:hypothetical protein